MSQQTRLIMMKTWMIELRYTVYSTQFEVVDQFMDIDRIPILFLFIKKTIYCIMYSLVQ